MTLSELYAYTKTQLSGFYDSNEAQIVSRRIIKMLTGHEAADIVTRPDCEVEVGLTQINDLAVRIKNNEPLEYIFNSAQFLDLELATDGAVLIPRPETEELAIMVSSEIQKRPSPARVLDIGTGSGCIPVYLKYCNIDAKIMACDISGVALKTASKNAQKYGCEIDFFECDILDYANNEKLSKEENFDIIVSNPPYVLDSEKALMQRNVLDFEPHNALFVPDENPLLFYCKIAEFASKKLNKNGMLFFEINERFGAETVKMMEGFGFRNCCIKKDLFGKDRMVVGVVNYQI